MKQNEKPIIIAADSDLMVHHAIHEALGEAYDILQAHDGVEVMKLVRTHETIIAIIMDPTMPNLDGMAATKQLKSDFSTYHIPIIMLTEQVNFEDIMEAVEAGADDYMHKPFRPEELKARLFMNIRQAERDQNANPLTKLPGNALINRIIRERMNQPMAVLYLDLDNFKAYNDKYGFNKGDTILQHAAHIMADAVRTCGNEDDFLGHLGGDDYVIVSTPDKARTMSETICKTFDASIGQFYNEEDRRLGKIISINRKGERETFPLISISIAVITNEQKDLTSIPQIAQLAAELKKYAKSKPFGETGSNFVIDRRKQ